MIGTLSIVAGAFGAFRREVLERVGGHEPGPGNDSDLTIRVRKLGLGVAFAGDATCLTNVPPTWRGWVRQRLRWDRNMVRNRARKHRAVFNLRHSNFSVSTLISFVDTLFFAVGLAFVWAVYVTDVTFFRRDPRYGIILLATYLLYSMLKASQVALALTMVRFRGDYLGSLLVLPLFVPYRILSRIVRIVAVVQEGVFRRSERDGFAPAKVRLAMPRF